MEKTPYVQSRIWLEEPEPNNAFACRAAYCHGYDVYGEMVGNAGWVDMLYLLFKGEAPSLLAGGELGPWVRRELSERRSLAGYGRPISNRRDERLEPILGLARSLGLADGPHVQLAHDIERVLLESRLRMSMNYGAIGAALTADLGLSPREHYLFGYVAFVAGMQPCYIDASERPSGTLLPLPCDGVAYQGVPKRSWNRP